MAYHFDTGAIRGIDVSGLTIAGVVFIPGNVLAGNWKQAIFVDDQASDEQARAIVDAFSGKLGGPLADTAARRLDASHRNSCAGARYQGADSDLGRCGSRLGCCSGG